MKVLLQIILFLFTVSKSYSQFPITNSSNNQILRWDSTYDIKSEAFYSLEQKSMIDYAYTITKENKIIAKIFRYDDSSYYFINYDSAGKKELQSGLLKMCNEIFKKYTLQIPDWIADPDGSKEIVKDTIIPDFSYRKHGLWKELDSIGLSWRGSYKNGLKEGIWRAGYNGSSSHTPINRGDIYDFNFRTVFSFEYSNGKVINKFQDSTFWPFIKGSWAMDQVINRGSEVLELNPTTLERCQYNFIDSSQVIIYKIIYNSNLKKSERVRTNAFWKQVEDCIEINDKGTLHKYKVLKMAQKRLILQKLKSNSNI